MNSAMGEENEGHRRSLSWKEKSENKREDRVLVVGRSVDGMRKCYGQRASDTGRELRSQQKNWVCVSLDGRCSWLLFFLSREWVKRDTEPLSG